MTTEPIRLHANDAPRREGWLAEYETDFERDPEYVAERLAIRFTEQISGLLIREDMTRADLAEAMGVTRAYVSKVFNAAPNLTLRSIANVALAMNAKVTISVESRNREMVAAPTPDAPALAAILAAMQDAAGVANEGAVGVVVPFLRPSRTESSAVAPMAATLAS